jgi:hypothetical protein
MRAYRRLQTLIGLAFVAYVALPPAATVWQPTLRGDLFPLSMWAMFYRVHNVMEDFGLLILEVGDERLIPPRYLEDAGPRFRAPGSIAAYHTIQALGRALAAGDARQVAALRTLLEAHYIHPSAPATVGYRIVRRRWDPIRRWRQHDFLSEEPMETFRAGALAATP